MVVFNRAGVEFIVDEGNVCFGGCAHMVDVGGNVGCCDEESVESHVKCDAHRVVGGTVPGAFWVHEADCSGYAQYHRHLALGALFGVGVCVFIVLLLEGYVEVAGVFDGVKISVAWAKSLCFLERDDVSVMREGKGEEV